MSGAVLTRMRLAGGVWEGLLSSAGAVAPELRVRHRDEVVGEAEATPATGEGGAGRWLVRFRLPTDRISDGVHTFVVEDAATGEALAAETLVAGEPLDHDIRAEVELLRAELDMLKRAFRRHCAET